MISRDEALPPAFVIDSRGHARRAPVRYGFETVPVDPFAALLVALLCMQALGRAVLAAELAVIALLLVSRWRDLPDIVARTALLLLLPGLAMLSATWSPLPLISLRYGVQLLLTVLASLMLARFVPARRLALIVFAGTMIASLAGIASGRTGVTAEGPVLIGFAGSKNQMGYIALFWLIASVAVLLDRERRGWLRLVALGAIPVAALVIVQSHATTALVLAIAGTAAFLVLLAFARMPRGARLFALFAGLLGAIWLSAAAPQIEQGIDRFRSDVLLKDDTLTGRTRLWEQADTLIAQAPVIGHGYRAIWMGEIGAGLLARAQQSDPRGFHFHDTLREIAVDFGVVGLAVFVLGLAVACARLAWLMVLAPQPFLAFAGAILLLVGLRMRTELIVGPFLIDTVLLYAALGIALFAPAPAEPEPRDRQTRQSRRRAATARRPDPPAGIAPSGAVHHRRIRENDQP